MATIKPRPVVYEEQPPNWRNPRGLRAWLHWKFGNGWKHWRTYRVADPIPAGWRVRFTECWFNDRTGDVRQVERVKYEPFVAPHRDAA